MKNKGFTLIELLVVVAIIGILATVVTASLGSARTRSRDAKVKLGFKEMKTQIAFYLNEHIAEVHPYNNSGGGAGTVTTAGATNNLKGVCNDTDMLKILKSTAAAAGNTLTCTVGNNGDSLLVYVRLPSQTTGFFCMDSSNYFGEISGNNPAVYQAGSFVRCV